MNQFEHLSVSELSTLAQECIEKINKHYYAGSNAAALVVFNQELLPVIKELKTRLKKTKV